MKITVVGCGAGALATAADLSLREHDVTLYVSVDHAPNFDDIRKDRIIIYNDKTVDEGPVFVPISSVTHDKQSAFCGRELILVVAPSFAHEDIAYEMAEYVDIDDVVVICPGSTGGSLVFKRVFDRVTGGRCPMLGEMHTLPYTVRKESSDTVNVMLHVEHLLLAALPATMNKRLHSLVRQIYPDVVLCSDVFETGLNNGNATTHPAPMVLNAGKIECYGKHSHYAEGITPSVAEVVQQIDDERKRICHAFGYKELDIKDRLFLMGYCPRRETVYECITSDESVFMPIEGPNTLDNRYLTEDAPYSLVAMRSLAQLKGVKTPLMDSVICLAGALMGQDYMNEGRTLESMGIDDMTYEEVMDFVRRGIEK